MLIIDLCIACWPIRIWLRHKGRYSHPLSNKFRRDAPSSHPSCSPPSLPPIQQPLSIWPAGFRIINPDLLQHSIHHSNPITKTPVHLARPQWSCSCWCQNAPVFRGDLQKLLRQNPRKCNLPHVPVFTGDGIEMDRTVRLRGENACTPTFASLQRTFFAFVLPKRSATRAAGFAVAEKAQTRRHTWSKLATSWCQSEEENGKVEAGTRCEQKTGFEHSRGSEEKNQTRRW